MRLLFHWTVTVALATTLNIPDAATAQESRHSPHQIQQALVEAGYDLGAVDGLWGRRSISALKAFQKAHNLAQTGVLDNATTPILFPSSETVRRPLTPIAADPTEPTSEKKTDDPAEHIDAKPKGPDTEKTSDKSDRLLLVPSRDAPTDEGPKLSIPPPPDVPGSADTPDDADQTGLSSGIADLLLLGFAVVLAWWWKRKRRAHQAIFLHSEEGFFPKNEQQEQPDRPVAGPIVPAARFDKPRSTIGVSPQFADSIALQNARTTERLLEHGPEDLVDQAELHIPILVEADEPPVDRGFVEPANIAPTATVSESPALHNAKVAEFIRQRGPIPLLDAAAPPRIPRFDWSPAQVKPAVSQPSQAIWMLPKTVVIIGQTTIPGGMIYVGNRLPKQGITHDAENCLIDPRLPVASRGDPQGQTMGYWPSYSRISPEARKSYLDWLAGRRSDPGVYIGYVFLYFYGLERRLLLDDDASDAEAVAAEVRRLLQVYGGNGSFKRYAGELLSAYELKSARLPEKLYLEVEENSYEIPLMLKVALGLRVRSGEAIEPDLLFAYVIADPETRVRTPARRAQTLLRELFAEAVEKQYPNGVRVSATRARKLKVNYRACSGTFALEIHPFGGDLPDITNRSEPITSARRIFDDCTDRLDDYSRMLGRSEGLKPTLAAVAKLPMGSRAKNAERLAARPLSRLGELADNGNPVAIQDLAVLAGMDPDKLAARAKQQELSGMLAAFGYGNTADPSFSLRAAKLDELAIVFRLEREADTNPEPGDRYRPLQLSIMLGMVIAFADGHLHPLEKHKLLNRIDKASGLSMDERIRLKAELKICEANAGRVADWTKRIGDVPETRREELADELVVIAAADGTIHAREVSQLEKFFKQIGLDENSLYSRLHGSIAPQNKLRDGTDEISLIIPAGTQPPGVPVPPAPKRAPSTRVDISRLEAIRRETRTTASVLADIFLEEEPRTEPQPVIEEINVSNEGTRFDGLERRYGWLLSELVGQESWTAADFERLVRGADLMPGAAKQALNDWSLDRFDELVLEGDDPIVVNVSLFPETASQPPSLAVSVEGISA